MSMEVKDVEQEDVRVSCFDTSVFICDISCDVSQSPLCLSLCGNGYLQVSTPTALAVLIWLSVIVTIIFF